MHSNDIESLLSKGIDANDEKPKADCSHHLFSKMSFKQYIQYRILLILKNMQVNF